MTMTMTMIMMVIMIMVLIFNDNDNGHDNKMSYLPVQCLPSPSNPLLQVQLNDPWVLLH